MEALVKRSKQKPDPEPPEPAQLMLRIAA